METVARGQRAKARPESEDDGARTWRQGDRALWGAMDEIRDRLGPLEGKVTVLIGIAGATFLGVFGLMMATVFGR